MTDTPDQDPVSLDELARAFAQAMGTPSNGRDPEERQPPVAETGHGG